MFYVVSLLAFVAVMALQCGEAAILSGKVINNLNHRGTSHRKPPKYVKVVGPPETVVHQAGTHLVLACNAMGSPIPTINWLRNGELQYDYELELDEILAPVAEDSLGEVVSKLVVDQPTNGEMFTCVATSGKNQRTASTTVYVEGQELAPLAAAAPIITAASLSVVQPQASTLLLPCRVHSATKCVVSWSREGLPIDTSDRINVLPSGDLLIRQLTWDDMGEFNCTATNAYGEDRAGTFVYPSEN